MSRLRDWFRRISGWPPRQTQAEPDERVPGEFRIERKLTRDTSNPYEGERSEQITVSDGCFEKSFWSSEYGNSEGWKTSGVEAVEIEGQELVVRHAEDGREERIPLPTRAWLETQQALTRDTFSWHIHDRALAILRDCPIRELDLRSSWLTREGFAWLDEMDALEDLVVGQLPEGAAACLARIPNLRRLVLPSDVGDDDIAALAAAPRLEEVKVESPDVDWSDDALTDACAADFGKMRALRVLDLSGCRGLTETGRQALRALGLEALHLPPDDAGSPGDED